MIAVPVGGTTGLDHQDNPAIDEAARCLATEPNPPRPIVPSLQKRFGLTPIEACIAIRESAAEGRDARDGARKARSMYGSDDNGPLSGGQADVRR